MLCLPARSGKGERTATATVGSLDPGVGIGRGVYVIPVRNAGQLIKVLQTTTTQPSSFKSMVELLHYEIDPDLATFCCLPIYSPKRTLPTSHLI